MKNEHFDVIVVGSGISGGYAAKVFTEKGKEVLVLESGSWLSKKMLKDAETMAGDEFTNIYKEPESKDKDFVKWHQGPFDTWGDFARRLDSMLHDDKDFICKNGTQFSFVHFDVVGGRSLMWGRVTPRLAKHDFHAASQDGYGVNWPICYEDLDGYYSRVENYMGLKGQVTDNQEMPSGIYNQGSNPCGKILKSFDGVEVDGHTVQVVEMPHATLRYPHNGRHVVSKKAYGQVYDNIHPDHYNSVHAPLKDAESTGLLTLYDNKMVTKVLLDKTEKRAMGVEAIDRETKAVHYYHADVVFLCASTVYSTKILLNSTSKKHPTGLGNQSDQLGRHLMDHMIMPGADGFIPLDKASFDKEFNYGTAMIPRFTNLGGESESEYIRSFQYQCFTAPAKFDPEADSPIEVLKIGANKSGNGGTRVIVKDEKASLEKKEHVQYGAYVRLVGFGEMLSDPDNRLTLSDEVDEYGVRKIAVEVHYCDNDRKLVEASRRYAHEILKSVGAKHIRDNLIKSVGREAPMVGLGIHEMGTARMGDSPDNSVLNAHNQVWGVNNLYCTDGACMPSTGVANPSITYMALTERAVDHAVANEWQDEHQKTA